LSNFCLSALVAAEALADAGRLARHDSAVALGLAEM
jgi:hypothetical protein